MITKTGMDYFLSLSIFELADTAKEVAEIGEQRARISDKNRR